MLYIFGDNLYCKDKLYPYGFSATYELYSTEKAIELILNQLSKRLNAPLRIKELIRIVSKYDKIAFIPETDLYNTFVISIPVDESNKIEGNDILHIKDGVLKHEKITKWLLTGNLVACYNNFETEPINKSKLSRLPKR